MNTRLIILFLLFTVLLIVLSYLLLQTVEAGSGWLLVILLSAGVVVTIGLLIRIFSRFMKWTPPEKNQ